MKFIKGTGNLRPISRTQTSFWPLTPPPPPAIAEGFSFSNSLLGIPCTALRSPLNFAAFLQDQNFPTRLSAHEPPPPSVGGPGLSPVPRKHLPDRGILGENKIYDGENNLVGPFLVHKLLGPRPPLPPVLILPWPPSIPLPRTLSVGPPPPPPV